MLNSTEKLNNLSYMEYQKYARQIIIDEIKEEGQNRLKKAKVIFVGAGGLNASAMMYLTASGIGEIGIIDDDIVELSNLQRQVIYRQDDLKRKKVEAADNNLAKLSRSTKIRRHNQKLTKENIVSVLSNYELVIDGTDNFKARYLIGQYCYKLHKIHIYGAIDKFIGQISTLNYQNSISYYNMLHEVSYSKIHKCNESGVINTLAGIIGLLQATEAIKVIIGIGSISYNQLLIFNLLDCSLSKTKIKSLKLTKSNVHIKQARMRNASKKYISISSATSDSDKRYTLLDIRTDTEFKLGHLSNAINMPLSNLKKKSGMQKIKKLADKHDIIIYCNNSTRSHIASQILDKYAIKHYVLDNRPMQGKRGIRTLVK